MTAIDDTIVSTYIPTLGTFEAPGRYVDLMIARLLPASPQEVRAIASEAMDGWYISTTVDVTSLLILLAHIEAGRDEVTW